MLLNFLAGSGAPASEAPAVPDAVQVPVSPVSPEKSVQTAGRLIMDDLLN